MFVEIIGIYLGMSILALILFGGTSIVLYTIIRAVLGHNKKKKRTKKVIEKNEPKELENEKSNRDE